MAGRRKYPWSHRRLRAALAPHVATGTVPCWRCGELIRPEDAWDLGHDDHDRSITRGPEHAGPCNRSAAATLGNAARKPDPPLRTSQEW